MNARRGALVVSNGDMTATTLERPASTEEAILTAADRCDQCGARARVRVTLTSGGRLFFCAHHGSKHLAPIASKASEILDERHLLLED
ncbi:hypothetical protein HMPREF9004_0032 [Schaalia cardiffensis F0333]|uniref:DUF7455 domain-containing protein n=2 Tax=Schaalia TaxID=2529408 RepID=N6XD08_9ACTO|nr:hypothetical protein HMPREF9004_0032 [Schaalia cardiffensis F0333]